MAINQMPEAQGAYNQSMTSLQAAHATMNALAAETPVDWAAYKVALKTCNALQKAAQTAQQVLQAAILDTPTVADLQTKLAADTAEMKAKTDALTADAAALNSLVSVATDTNGILTTISRYV